MSTAYDIRDELVLAFNGHDLRRLSQCYSPSAVLVGPEGVAEGQEQIATFWEQLLTAFLDARLTPWYKAAVSDPAVTEWCLTGTHMGPLLLPSGRHLEGTGRQVAIRGCCVLHVENDRIVTHQQYYDQLELYSQLGFRHVCDCPCVSEQAPDRFPSTGAPE
ncbi:ester cyclase [Microbispora bryophytorum]|uniref:Ester cyclase n=1 Tax=Microbispora bryophytorum TaxID=1460882 RepID=A0A8H9H7C1_9ACTN|nr:ester cyclase [Microbispora bryophytorum]MBD3137898.1 ester cyclase [Microbispora bryophytorum]TQS05633.1 ester cyclase [Microbispora bryophytorum]GGO21562.1 hypothetical protein GCM10011574_49070 [Microbispora bryophytorum]